MTRLYDLDIPVLRKGGIHIKKKNRGKFTESAKRAGMGVQEYARHVLANKDKYSSTLVKRANFARNAKKFKHENGGILKAQNPSGTLPDLIERINKKSKANFVKRLLDPNRKSIQNWVNPLSISTHKLGWATEDTKQGAFVYPEVQEINGELIDFTHPSHRRSEGINSAIERRDTVRMTPEQAKWFTENYKQYYPGFKDGGILKAQEGTGNLYAPQPLSPLDIALNQAKIMSKTKEKQSQPQQQQQHLPSGVKEVIGPDGQKIAIRTEQPLVPLEQSIAEWLPGTGDIAEADYIANDIKNGNLGSAALGAGLAVLPGGIANWFRKRIPNNYSAHFNDFLKKRGLSDNFTVEDIEEYIKTLDPNNPSEQAIIRNWNNRKSYFLTDDTYHKALTPQQIAEEFPKMAVISEPYSNEVQKELVSRYYKEQKFPRLVKNFERSGMKIEDGDLKYLEDLYSKPFDYIPATTDYMPPGYGGFYDSIMEKVVVPENSNIFTLSHEAYHGLRYKLFEILKRYYESVPILPEGLTQEGLNHIYDSMYARQFLPHEINLIEPLGMSKKYSKDKVPILEISAPVGGELPLKKWLEFYNTHGRYPSPIELDDFVDRTLTMPQARSIGYGRQIGTKALEKGIPDHRLLEYYKNAAKYLGAGAGAFAVSKQLNSNNQENGPIN